MRANAGATEEADVEVDLAASPRPGPGVTVEDPACEPDATEECNGLDDDCNGVIDDGCGYATGPIQITLAWDGGADLELYVTDPSGETLSPTHPSSGTGGRLDHDARGACRGTPTGVQVENVHWLAGRPPSGRYVVEAHYWGECNSSAGPTRVTVSVAVGGRLRGTYRGTLSPNERATMVTFRMR